MSPKMFRMAATWGALLTAANPGLATAQVCPTCAPPPVAYNACPPVTCNVCEQLQPVVQPCYRTVPVTEYRPTKVTVQRPITETEWIDRPCTEYRPVCETKTAEVPTVTWQTVTECRTVQKDMGCWMTSYECRPRVSPCQYDPRPGIAGWWNRTAYSMRSAMTPQVVARRHYVPNVVTQQIPVTRQVPQYGTRQVTYNVTRMEPHTTMRKVAVNKVRWVAEEVEQLQPVTVMKTITTGSTIAWVSPSSINGSATALNPVPDYNRPRSANRDYDDRDGFRRREAAAPFGDEQPVRPRTREAFDGEKDAPPPGVRGSRTSAPVIRPAVNEDEFPEARMPTRADPAETVEAPAARVPSIVRASRWTRSRGTQPAATPATGNSGTVTVARTAR